MGKRKNPYIAGIAQINFKPKFDWEIDEAKKLFDSTEHKHKHKIHKIDRIIYEDCIKGMQSLPEESVDLIIADPPFGIDFSGKEHFYNRKSEFVQDGYGEIEGDYDQFTELWIKELPRIMKDTASAYIFSGWTNLVDVLIAGRKAGLKLINHIIWKYQFGVFTKKKFVTSHYHVIFFVKNPKKYYFNKIEHYPLDIWEIPRTYMPGQKKNGTKLPENVVTRAINFSSKPGDLILDPFMGNGTTAVCSKINYRHYIGFEINEKMKNILDSNINSVKIGQEYRPYHTYLPSIEDLAEKYPAVKRYMIEQLENEREKEEIV